MDFQRRSFLVGAGALITTSFVRTARVFARNTGAPFLLPQQSAPQFLQAGPSFDCDNPGRFHLTIGKPQYEPSHIATWGEFLALEGHDVNDPTGWAAVSQNWEITRNDLPRPMNEYTWQCSWDCRYSPSARAFRFLEDLKLYPGDDKGRLGGIEFYEGQYPGSSDRWVEADDALSVSLLQARLRELRLPVDVVLGEME